MTNPRIGPYQSHQTVPTKCHIPDVRANGVDLSRVKKVQFQQQQQQQSLLIIEQKSIFYSIPFVRSFVLQL